MLIRGVLPRLFALHCPAMRDGFHYKFWVYILTSRSGTLYIGITGFFEKRIHQHKYDSIEGFTKKYQCHRLVYYESFQDVETAISREKQLKGWRRKLSDRKSTRLNSSHANISYAVFCLKKKNDSA